MDKFLHTKTMDFLLFFFLFLFGTIIGSFLNVLIDRLPRGENVFTGRSHCEFCHKTLVALDLIPLFSFIALKGKCRYCHKKLSLYYPIIELITGLLFVLVVFNFVIPAQAGIQNIVFYYLFIISSLIVLFFTDLRYGILPFSIILPATIVVFVYQLLTTNYLLLTNVFSAIGAFLFFLLIFFITRSRGMGFGDVIYVFFMGLLLGFPQIIIGLYIAFLTGAIVSLILVVAKRKKLHGGVVPFGPFLVLGTIMSMFWGEKILAILLAYLLK